MLIFALVSLVSGQISFPITRKGPSTKEYLSSLRSKSFNLKNSQLKNYEQVTIT